MLGNPPFVGAKYQSAHQRAQVRALARLGGSGGTLDYVAAWFINAGEYARSAADSPSPSMGESRKGVAPEPRSTSAITPPPAPPHQGEGKSPRIAFVATNSITQGEQVAQLCPILFHRYRLEIAFAHGTFVWDGRAGVHTVIIGLARAGEEPAARRLSSYVDGKGEPIESREEALTAYLFAARGADRHLVVKEESRPINGAPRIIIGSKPIDGGYLIFKANERAKLLQAEPQAERFLRPYVGAGEFINGGMRWILALQDAAPGDWRHLALVKERVAKVRAYQRGEIPAFGKSERKQDAGSRR